MAKLGINTGTSPNSSTGDTLLDGAIKINSNFNEIYTALGTGTTINLTTDKVTEGTNLYFTNEKAQDAIGSAISAGIQTGISVVYNDASNSINFNVGISTDSEKLSGQDPCFYLNYDNFYNYPEKNWVNVNQNQTGIGTTITGISTSYTFSTSRTVAGVSTNKLTVTGHLYYPTSSNVGPEVDVLVLYHGTIDTPAVTPLNSAQTFLNIATNSSQLNIKDKIIFSVAYPQDNIPAWNTGAANPATEFPEFGVLFNYSNFYFGDNITYAEAALLWVKEKLNSYLTSAGIGKSISRVYTFGHSQGGLIVHRLNTMHSVDGVIANAPGPIDLLSRCAYDEANGITTGTCYKIRTGIGSTSAVPSVYLDDSLKNYLSGTLSPMLFTQALNDPTGNAVGVSQTAGMLTIVQPGLSSCTEYGPIEFKYYDTGGHTSFITNTTQQADIRDYINSGITGSYTFYNVGIGTTNPTSKLTVSGNVNVSGIVTATSGFISVGNTTPIRISLVGNKLTFTAVGIGSTTFTLA